MRVLLVCDFDNRAAPPLLDALLREIGSRDGWTVVGLVDSGRKRAVRTGIPALVSRVLHGRPSRPTVRAVAADHDVPIVGDGSTSINDPTTVEEIAGLKVDLGFSFLCTQVWRQPLLEAVGRPVNYHDGVLPDHGGLWATAYSLYCREPRSGFTVHEMVEAIDAGPLLFVDSVPVRPEDDLRSLVARKRAAVFAAIPRIFDRIEAGTQGRPQAGQGQYHSASDGRRLTTIDDPSTIEVEELRHRLRSFGSLQVMVGGRRERVTAVADRRGLGRPRIQLSDGSLFVARISGRAQLPYRTVRRMVGPRLVARWTRAPR